MKFSDDVGAVDILLPPLCLTTPLSQVDEETGYIRNIDEIRGLEYPSLADTVYLDHAGTTLYAKSLIDDFSHELTNNLFGNPHSASASSSLSTRRIDDIRLQALRFFNASPEHFDLVFVANATAAIKLVADAFRDAGDGFWYGYHEDSHTSLVGVRGLASHGSRCFHGDREVAEWIGQCRSEVDVGPAVRLFAYPGQSNMTGHRPPYDWCRQIREASGKGSQSPYTLYDAAALLSTSELDLSDPERAPDFIALSFYKIFGFPDLGALIVRKGSEAILRQRKYFAGGTVDLVTNIVDGWHAKKGLLHESLEDGTLPFHNIMALGHGMENHTRLYGSMKVISRHVRFLKSTLSNQLEMLRHGNGKRVCRIHGQDLKSSDTTGPVIAFNLLDNSGGWVKNSDIEKLGIVQSIQFRTGGLCNPGGIAKHLELSAEEMMLNYSAGHRCGSEIGVMNGKPTGAIRVSLGAMSNITDIQRFMSFINEFYVDRSLPRPSPNLPTHQPPPSTFIIESMSVFPIKSCAAFRIPLQTDWEVLPKGLAWDREWCLVHQGTGVALSQKQYPRMALLKPVIDLVRREMIVRYHNGIIAKSISIPLDFSGAGSSDSSLTLACERFMKRDSTVCGENVSIELYTSPDVVDFFSEVLSVPCTLARCPNDGDGSNLRYANIRKPKSVQEQRSLDSRRPIKLANESPILLVSRSSVNRLNENIKQNCSNVGKTVTADSFRANIVVAEELRGGQKESPYVEDSWTRLRTSSRRRRATDDRMSDDEEEVLDRSNTFEILGPCQRCQMVCVDQKSAEKRPEPFSTLAKTRRKEGKVWFGMHMCLASTLPESSLGDRIPGAKIDIHSRYNDEGRRRERTFLRVGDPVWTD